MQAHTRERRKKQQHPNEFIYYCSIFYAIQFIACYLSSAGTIFAFSLSCLFIFALKHARHVRQNVTSSQCTHAKHLYDFMCVYCVRLHQNDIKANEKNHVILANTR